MIYADYDFYCEQYCGTYVSKEDFQNLAIRAKSKLDAHITREISPEDVCDELKFALCEICDLLLASDNHSGIEYERNDGYWVSYEDEEKTDDRIKSCVKTWLSGTDLLYRGRD